MTTHDRPVGRICTEVQTQLPGFVDGTLPRWRRRMVAMHVKRCPNCGPELHRQRTVAAGLSQLEAAAAATSDEPPEGLLDALLAEAENPGMRGRAAVPARGAVSGARPGLSIALLVVGAAAGTAAGYAGWRGARAVRGRLGGRRG